jgi:predicted enzyme related to lactoylglutathione lyase
MTFSQESRSALLLNVDVPSIDQGERFYAAAFELEPGRRFGGKALEMLGWAAPLYLLEKDEETIGAANQLRSYDRHWTPIHLDVVVSHLDEALQRALNAGATLEADAFDTPFGRMAMLADPFGNGFCLIEFNSGGYDAVAD